MKFIVLFEDDPVAGQVVRAEHMPAHLAFLCRHAAGVEAAGPLADRDGSPAGGLWVIDASDADEVRRLVEEDPFWTAGLRKAVRVLAWTQVFADHAPGGESAGHADR